MQKLKNPTAQRTVTEQEVKLIQSQLYSTVKLRKGVKEIMNQFLQDKKVHIHLISSKSKLQGKDHYKPQTIFPVLLYMLIKTKKLKCSFELHKKQSKSENNQQFQPVNSEQFSFRQFSTTQNLRQHLHDMIKSQLKYQNQSIQVSAHKSTSSNFQYQKKIQEQQPLTKILNQKKITLQKQSQNNRIGDYLQNEQLFQIQELDISIFRKSEDQCFIQVYQLLHNLFQTLRLIFKNKLLTFKTFKCLQIIQNHQDDEPRQQRAQLLKQIRQYQDCLFRTIVQMFTVVKINCLKLSLINIQDFIDLMILQQNKHTISQENNCHSQKQASFNDTLYSIHLTYPRKQSINFDTISKLIQNIQNLTILILQHPKKTNQQSILYQTCNQLIASISLKNIYLQSLKIKHVTFKEFDINNFAKMIEECPFLTDIQINTIDKTQYQKILMSKADQQIFQENKRKKKQLMNAANMRGINNQLYIDNIKLLKTLNFDYENVLGILDKIKPIIVPYSIDIKNNYL